MNQNLSREIFCFFAEFFGYTFPGGICVKIFKNIILYAFGGLAYLGMELLWRGRSHGSMFLAGGACFLLLGALNRARPRLPGWLRFPAGALIITMVELAVGLLVNRRFAVWDYRDQWGNFCGQICPAFTALWIPISALAMGVYELLEPSLDRILGRQTAKNRHG